MPSRQVSNLRPLWRFRHPLNQQKVTNGEPPPQKDVKNEGRSGNVYENKGSNDKLSDTVSGICARLKPILQKNSRLEGHFAVNDALGTGFLRKYAAFISPSPWPQNTERPPATADLRPPGARSAPLPKLLK